MEEEKKIAIVGLSNAGKTSIIKSLLQEFEILSHLKPTMGIEHQQVTLFGQNLIFWDFGGQETYRKRYLASVDRYFPEIYLLYYVVDIQDAENLDESLKYFEQVIAAAKSQNSQVRVNILFHKWDPVIIDPEEKRVREENKMKFLDKALMLVPDNIPARIFETSIFQPLGIINAISVPLFNREGFHDQMSQLLQDLVERYQFLFGILFTEKFFEIGRYFPKNAIEDSLRDVIMGFFENFKSNIQFSPNFMLDCKTYKIIASKFTIAQRNREFPMILAIGYNESIEPKISDLQIELNKLLQNIPLALVI